MRGLFFFGAVVFTILGVIDIVHSIFANLNESDSGIGLERRIILIALAIMKSVDLLLRAIVLYIFSLGLVVLFDTREEGMRLKLPQWLQVKNFMELKIVLWEAILTTMVISFLSRTAEKAQSGEELTLNTLIIPGSILFISLSLFFLKKGESH